MARPPRFANMASVEGTGAGAAFDVRGVELCIINALRRVMMVEIPTVAFPLDTASGMVIHRNTSALHNEFLGHRVAMVPIALDENQLHTFDPANWKFRLHAKNLELPPTVVSVTTDDFVVRDRTGAKLPDAARSRVLPRGRLSGDPILLVHLRPSPLKDRQGEEVDIECVPSLGVGTSHARWSPVCRCHFSYVVDEDAAGEELVGRLAALGLRRGGGAEAEALERDFWACDAMRCHARAPNGDPALVRFVVEGVTHALRPAYLVFRGLQVLLDKVGAFEQRMRAPGGEGGGVTVTPVQHMDGFYAITVMGEDHTLGNLVQSMLHDRWVAGSPPRLVYIGYHQPHPLEDYILFKVKCQDPDADVRALLAEGAALVSAHLRELLHEWVAFSSLAGAGLVAVEEWLARSKQGL